MKILKIKSEDIQSIHEVWETNHEVYINDKFTGLQFYNQDYDINSIVKKLNDDETFLKSFEKSVTGNSLIIASNTILGEVQQKYNHLKTQVK